MLLRHKAAMKLAQLIAVAATTVSSPSSAAATLCCTQAISLKPSTLRPTGADRTRRVIQAAQHAAVSSTMNGRHFADSCSRASSTAGQAPAAQRMSTTDAAMFTMYATRCASLPIVLRCFLASSRGRASGAVISRHMGHAPITEESARAQKNA
jgi:hypothetical protein